jgi:hypothetical protein
MNAVNLAGRLTYAVAGQVDWLVRQRCRAQGIAISYFGAHETCAPDNGPRASDCKAARATSAMLSEVIPR